MKLLGIDIGTSGCKVLMIDETGRLLKQSCAEYPVSVPHPMWSEQNPDDWWTAVRKCLAEIGEVRPDAIGLTGQMHGSVFLDAHNEIIRPAILWNDQRTIEECAEIERTIGRERLMEITCNPALTGFQLPKILWLRNHELSNYLRTTRVLLPKDYIRFKLTDAFKAEVSDASGTGLFDVPNRLWSEEIMLALELDPAWFPECHESKDVTARTIAPGPDSVLAGDVPVVGGGGDQAAAAVGTGAVQPGVISVSLGTSGVVFTAIDGPRYEPAGTAHTFCHANESWHAMGVMLSCGGALRWYRDTLGRGLNYDEMATEAEVAKPGSAGVTFLPYLTGERCPHNDPYARAAFAGLGLGHGTAHLSRAVFEGISFGLFDCLNLIKSLGGKAEELRITGGGAKSRFWTELLADITKTPCVSLQVDEGPAFGAAILAGVGIGVWSDVATACRAVVRLEARTVPSGVDYLEPYNRYRELYTETINWNRL